MGFDHHPRRPNHWMTTEIFFSHHKIGDQKWILSIILWQLKLFLVTIQGGSLGVRKQIPTFVLMDATNALG
jgi:hypothetical protein